MNFLKNFSIHLLVVAGLTTGLLVAGSVNVALFSFSGIQETVFIIVFTAMTTLVALNIALKLQNKGVQVLVEHFNAVASNHRDLDSKIPKQAGSSLNSCIDSYNKIINRVVSTFKDFKSSTNDLAFTASKMAEVTERTETNIRKQQLETDQVATAMNEMSSTVEEVARSATDASKAAQHAYEAASNGVKIASNTKTEIDTLVNEAQHAAEVIAKLADESQNIGVVLDVIKGIAEQTNLLALNAAIEAARAGEQGRGFAVVADEVRTLASKTQTSTSEIEEMIGRLQTGVSNAVTVMNASLEKGRNGSSEVDNTISALDEIMTAVNSINDMNAQIATAAEEQSAVANEINRNISVISQVADQTTMDAHESRQTAEKLADISMKITQSTKGVEFSGAKALDLSSAKAAHLNWKTRLRSFLDGKESLSIEQAVSHKHCDFGKWYYSKGLADFGDLSAIVDVEAPHEELHRVIKTIVELKHQGKIAEAEEAYKKVSDISGRIVALLDEAERQASH